MTTLSKRSIIIAKCIKIEKDSKNNHKLIFNKDLSVLSSSIVYLYHTRKDHNSCYGEIVDNNTIEVCGIPLAQLDTLDIDKYLNHYILIEIEPCKNKTEFYKKETKKLFLKELKEALINGDLEELGLYIRTLYEGNHYFI